MVRRFGGAGVDEAGLRKLRQNLVLERFSDVGRSFDGRMKSYRLDIVTLGDVNSATMVE